MSTPSHPTWVSPIDEPIDCGHDDEAVPGCGGCDLRALEIDLAVRAALRDAEQAGVAHRTVA